MTFAELRQSVLHGTTLSLDFWAEDVQFTPRSGAAKSLRVKIQHEQGSNDSGRKPNEGNRRGSVDELERILVTVSRDPTWAAGPLVQKPDPGDRLNRTVLADSDVRPFSFTGEVVYQGDDYAVYVFARARQFVKGGSR